MRAPFPGGVYDGKTWSISRFPKITCILTKKAMFFQFLTFFTIVLKIARIKKLKNRGLQIWTWSRSIIKIIKKKNRSPLFFLF